MAKPFLILQIRPEDEASDDEFAAFLRAGQFEASQAHRVRIEQEDIPTLNLDDYAGIIVGGGPSNISDKPEAKSSAQQRFEPQVLRLMKEVIEKDIPFLGACYGMGVLAAALGGEVSKKKYSEEVGALDIEITQDGSKDPLMRDLPTPFRAFGGHKEACQTLPTNAELLATSTNCPVQMIRTGKNVYATQFHPELDSAGLAVRISVYRHAGYFPPEAAEEMIEVANRETVTVPEMIMQRFIESYGGS